MKRIFKPIFQIIKKTYYATKIQLMKIALFRFMINYAKGIDEKYVFKFNNLLRQKIKNFFNKITKYFKIDHEELAYDICVDSKSQVAAINYYSLLAKKYQKRFLSALLILILIISLNTKNRSSNKPLLPSEKNTGDYVANITIDGTISTNYKIYDSLKEIEQNNKIKAVILTINSGGGNVEPSEKIYKLIKKINEKKPVVTSVQGICASGAYMIAMSSRKIFAMSTSIIGSIGVFSSSFDASELAKKIGIKENIVKTSTIKGSSLFQPQTTEQAEMIAEMIKDIHSYFKFVVQIGRSLTDKEIEKVSDASVFIGLRALKLKLIDEIGDEFDALNWLKSEKLIDNNLQMKKVEINPQENAHGLFSINANFDNILNSIYTSIFGLKSQQIELMNIA